MGSKVLPIDCLQGNDHVGEATVPLLCTRKLYQSKRLCFVLGDHPVTAGIYNNIGRALDNKGDYDWDMAMYQKALTIKEAGLGDHPVTVATGNEMGILLH